MVYRFHGEERETTMLALEKERELQLLGEREEGVVPVYCGMPLEAGVVVTRARGDDGWL